MNIVWLWWVLCSILVVWWISMPASEKIRAYTVRSLRFFALQDAVTHHHISLIRALAILCQAWIFPTVLTVYLAVLVIDQTNVFGLKRSPVLVVLDQSRLLWMSIISGLASVLVDEQHEDKRYAAHTAPAVGWLFVAVCLWLALLGAYIIFLKTQEMGRIALVISALAGWLLVLIGFLLLEEEAH